MAASFYRSSRVGALKRRIGINALLDIQNIVGALEFRSEIVSQAVIVGHDALVRSIELVQASVRLGSGFRCVPVDNALVVLAVGAILALTRKVAEFGCSAACRKGCQ